MAFSSFSAEEGQDPIVAEINVTPLTDIFLVLLIIFMVTSTALVQQSAPVELPRASAGSERPSGLDVFATADGKIEIDGREIAVSELRATIAKGLEESATRNVILHGDRAVMLERAIEIMTAAKQAGAERVAIATQPAD